MFTRRHERDLAEIKALDLELGQRAQELLNKARQIRDEQEHGPPIAFVHIPKTAGTTITTMFARAYSKAGLHDAGNYFRDRERTEAKVARQRVANKRVTVGHAPYGLLRKRLPATHAT